MKNVLNILPIPVALIASAGIVIGSSNAAFNGFASNDGSEWRAGSISIGNSSEDSIGGNILFDDHQISPGYSASRCVTVNSRSDIETHAKMYGVNVSDNKLSETMTLTIDKGHINAEDANSTSCDSFRDGEQIFNGTLAGFGRDSRDYSRGLSRGDHGDHLSPGGNVTYMITISLPSTADNNIANLETGATFKWEAQG